MSHSLVFQTWEYKTDLWLWKETLSSHLLQWVWEHHCMASLERASVPCTSDSVLMFLVFYHEFQLVSVPLLRRCEPKQQGVSLKRRCRFWGLAEEHGTVLLIVYPTGEKKKRTWKEKCEWKKLISSTVGGRKFLGGNTNLCWPLHNKEGRNSAYTNIILLSSSCLKEKHHRSVIVCRNLDSHNFWQLFRSLKKEEVGGICILWGFPPFLSLLHSYRRSAKSGHGTRVHFLYPSRQSMRIMCSN